MFNLLTLKAELLAAHHVNDGSFHISMIRWAGLQFQDGRIPLDGWYPYLGLGSPLFHQYQSLPHALMGLVSVGIGAETAYSWSLYLLLASWPLTVYWGARLVGLERWPAAAAAFLSPLLVSASGYGFEHESYTWGGLGVWTQLWGMWLLPIAWGLSWRAVATGRSYWRAALVLALTFAVNFLAGYLALITIGAWVLVKPAELLGRLRRGLLILVGALLTGAWVLVPVLVDRKWANQSVAFRGFWRDSFGPRKVLGWLITGQLFDRGRLPVVTLLVAVGLGVCVKRFRRDEGARVLVVVWGLMLWLFCGRSALGPLVNLLPGKDDLQLHRFIMGVHLSGILLAGVGAAWIGEAILMGLRNLRPGIHRAFAPAVSFALLAAFTLPALYSRAETSAQGSSWIRTQVAADSSSDATDLAGLVARAKSIGPGRFYAGMRTNWGADYRIGSVPVYSELMYQDVEAVGFTFRTILSLSNDVESRFDETNQYHYDLFNIRYLLIPVDRRPAVKAELIERRGRHTLWKVETTGYLQVVDTATPISTDRADIGGRAANFLQSALLRGGLYPTVAFAGEVAASPTVGLQSTPPSGPAGRIESEVDGGVDGNYVGRVTAFRPSAILLKSTFHRRWKVTVDDVEVPAQMFSPSFVGRTVGPGTHTISFRYAPYPYYPLLFGVGILSLIALALWPRLRPGPSDD